MPAIPIYTASPINASKAPGVTPQTAHTEQQQQQQQRQPRTTPPLEAARSPDTYPAAQPGSRPSVPAPTGAPRGAYGPVPTPTTTTVAGPASPEAPQPGAFPSSVYSGSSRSSGSLPPPPRAGEHIGVFAAAPSAAQPTPVRMPPQMSYARPDVGVNRFSSTTATATAPIVSPMAGSGDLSHPPGYQQNVNASEFNSAQRAAHQVAVDEDRRRLSSVSRGNDDEGVWGTAKKWASAAGEGLAAAEQEVWRRINKD